MRGRWLPTILLATFAGCAAGGAAGTAARGCSAAGRSGSGLARSAHGLEELARVAPRMKPLTASRFAVAGEVGELGAYGAGAGARRLGATGAGSLERAAAALPEVEGSASALAKVPASSGARLVGKPGARSLAGDYARSIDAIGLSRKQHVGVLDALDVAQSLLDAATSGDDGDDGDDGDGDGGAASSAAPGRQARLTIVATELDMRLQQTLDDGQLQRLYGALGPPKVLAYRLARERPLQRPGPGLDSGRAPGDDLR